MTTDERVFEARLSEMLHRVTPEPPRAVTVEDVAIRLANQAAHTRPLAGTRGGSGRGGSGRGARRPNSSGPGRRDGRSRWAPLLAAASVVVVAGASTGIAVALSGSSKPAGPTDGVPPASQTGVSVSSPAVSPPAGSSPAGVPPAANGKQPWGAVPNLAQTVNASTLVGGDGALFGLTDTALVKLSPSTGAVQARAGYPSGFPNQPPVVAGHNVWLVWNYSESGVELRSFGTGSLAQTHDITVGADGAPSGQPEGILAATPAGDLWVGAGSSVKLVNPATGAVLRSIPAGGPVSAVAVSPDGSRVYAGVSAGNSLKVTEYDASSGAAQGTWTPPGQSAGNLLATAGGAWLVTGGGTSGQLWFAPAGNLAGARAVATDSDITQDFEPTYSGGAVWAGGNQALRCLDPMTGNVRATAPVTRGNGAPGAYGDVAISGGHALALYLSAGLQAGGATPIYPPAACFS